jgi:hypothetical protein
MKLCGVEMGYQRHLGIDHEDLTPSGTSIKVYRYPLRISYMDF